MEPMTLGSAPSSPVSPGVNPNFLPGFLMGEQQPQTSNPNNTSPGRIRNNSGSGPFKLGVNTSEPRNLRQKLFNQSISESPVAMSPLVSEKAGPPKLGLFDTFEQRRQPTSPLLSSTIAVAPDSPAFNESISRINNEDTLNYSRNLHNLNESLNRTNNLTLNNRFDKIDSLWVTVFGFLPSTLGLVLSHLSSCGPIVEKKLPSHGNWVHVKFNNINEVARALSLNGKCINDATMIGVSLYHPKEGKENENVSFQSPIRARSLRQSFISSPSNNSVLPVQNVPQKSTGLVTKAMEYVFGW